MRGAGGRADLTAARGLDGLSEALARLVDGQRQLAEDFPG
jgi:hypothetical protein